MLRILLALVAVPPTLASLSRMLLLLAARGRPAAGAGRRPSSWLVVVPSRAEGNLVDGTLRSIEEARRGNDVSTILLLDGDDAEARALAATCGAEALVKASSGPTKAAALAWLCSTQRDRIAGAGALLLLDVGSRLDAAFFDEFSWPDDAAAAQARLRSLGRDVGEAAVASERLAQRGEDGGRERLGWSVRLRGTGSVYRPTAFLDVIPRLTTQAEDEEATLLIAAGGGRVAMAGGDAWVIDDKPSGARLAAGQRARWLAGRLQILMRHGSSLATLARRRPLEAAAFALDLLGKPLSLTVLLRLAIAAPLLATWRGTGVAEVIALLAAATAFIDAATLLATGVSLRAAAMLSLSWLGAVLLVPRAFVRWVGGRRGPR